MKLTIQDAIRAIDPTLAFHINPDGVPSLTNLGGTLPSDEEIDVKLAELQAEYDSKQYARNRKSEYPSIPDQLDYIYHHGVEKWKADMILPVKEKYPKGAE